MRLRRGRHLDALPLLVLVLFLPACGAQSDTSSTPAAEETVADGYEQPTTSATSSSTTSTTAPAADEADEFPGCEPADHEGPVVVGGPLEAGTSRSLTIQKERSNTPGSSATPVAIEVLDTTGDGTTLRWTSQASVLTGVAITPAVQRIIDQAPRQKLDYLVDPEGSYARVINIDEVRRDALDSLDLLAPLVDEDAAAAIEELYRTLPDPQIELLFAEGPMVFHAFDGLTLTPGDSIEFEDALPNTFGGEPFPATTTISVDDRPDDQGCVTVTLITAPVPDEFARIMWESVESAFGPAPDEAEILDQFDVRNEVIARVDPASGSVRSVEATQSIAVADESRVETMILREVRPDS